MVSDHHISSRHTLCLDSCGEQSSGRAARAWFPDFRNNLQVLKRVWIPSSTFIRSLLGTIKRLRFVTYSGTPRTVPLSSRHKGPQASEESNPLTSSSSSPLVEQALSSPGSLGYTNAYYSLAVTAASPSSVFDYEERAITFPF
jgi:hypothetical protein